MTFVAVFIVLYRVKKREFTHQSVTRPSVLQRIFEELESRGEGRQENGVDGRRQNHSGQNDDGQCHGCGDGMLGRGAVIVGVRNGTSGLSVRIGPAEGGDADGAKSTSKSLGRARL